MFVCLFGDWLISWLLVGWLVGWFVGWLVGWGGKQKLPSGYLEPFVRCLDKSVYIPHVHLNNWSVDPQNLKLIIVIPFFAELG